MGNTNGDPDWGKLPGRGWERNDVLGKVYEMLVKAKQSTYPPVGSTPVLSFPGAIPHELALTVMGLFAPLNANNIQCHTLGDGHTGEDEFSVTTNCEREAIAMEAGLCGANLGDVDGYIASGGTEGNVMGMWIGREWLYRNGTCNTRKAVPIAVLGSYETHYSIRKGLQVTGIGESPESDGSGFHALGVGEDGSLELAELFNRVIDLDARGIRHFIIVLTAGTCIGGGVDRVDEIDELLDRVKRMFTDAYFYVHVDAAFGGFVLPFLEAPISFGFESSCVQSISMDPHKMGLMPYSCGTFLCRKGLLGLIERSIEYVPGHGDCTLSGSRSGAIAVALWALLKHLGFEGYAKMIRDCRNMALYAQVELAKIPGISVVRSPINFASFSWDQEKLKDDDPIAKQFTLRGSMIPEEFRDQAGRKKSLIKIPIMPHTTGEHIDQLVSALRVRMSVVA